MTTIEDRAEQINSSERWYRQPMVWMIIAIPLTAVIMGGVMLSLSISSFDGLVADDYYKKGKEINRALEHEPGLLRPDQIELNLLHRTRSGLDKTVILEAFGDQHYRGNLESLATSHWLVQLETDTWRINGQATLPGDQSIQLNAQ